MSAPVWNRLNLIENQIQNTRGWKIVNQLNTNATNPLKYIEEEFPADVTIWSTNDNHLQRWYQVNLW